MKHLLKSSLIVAGLSGLLLACDNNSTPDPAREFSAVFGETSYEAPVNGTVTVEVTLRGEGISAVTANGQALNFTPDQFEQELSLDFTVPANATVGQEFPIEFVATTGEGAAEFTTTVSARGETSETPLFLALTPEFSGVEIDVLLTSEDQLAASPDFVYGSMADGAGLLANQDGSFTLINNIEADFSVARIIMDANLRPFSGEYILNAQATGFTAQCSGSLITVEEHGFGPLYLSGGEWSGGSADYAPGVYRLDVDKDAAMASSPDRIAAMGEWITENAVAIGKDAYEDKTVVIIGDDDSNNSVPEGHLAMYVGDRGDLNGGKLYALRVTSPGIDWEVDMEEGRAYDAEFVELMERDLTALNTECLDKGVMGFSRVEDIDWRRGSADNQRSFYFAVTGRERDALRGRGTFSGRIYKVELNDNDPAAPARITCVLDGDKVGGIASGFHSPDNVLVTENYIYIQEDPNGISGKTGFAKLYQYNIETGVFRTVLECDQDAAEAAGYGTTGSTWELTGMIDVSDITGQDDTFLLITQNHGWEPADGSAFTDPDAVEQVDLSIKEGSMLYLVKGLER